MSTANSKREIVRVQVRGLHARFVYSDAAAGLIERAAQSTTRRASHVEPAESFGWECDGWLADMKPVGGPLLFAGEVDGVKRPFKTRQKALDAERAYLREHMGI